MLRSLPRCTSTILARRSLAIRAQHGKAAAPSTSSNPYPLPLSPQVMEMEKDENFDDLLPSPLPRLNETTSSLRARLVYQSRKRGMLEGDLLLSTFAKEQLPVMSVEELKQFDKVLPEPSNALDIILITAI
jgi:succinate dehydrogenase assembly factor 2